MKGVKLIVAYPQPKDAAAFEKIYQQEHVPMAIANLHGKTKMVATKILIASSRISVLLRCRGSFSVVGGTPAVRGVCRRQGNLGPCREDIVWRPSRHHDRRRGHVYILSSEV